MTLLTMPVRKILQSVFCVFCLFLANHAVDGSTAYAEMATVETVDVLETSVTLKTDSSNLNFDYYTLGAPPRLVVDVMDALPQFEERSFRVPSGFAAVRVGMYADKTRFVFDSAGDELPVAKVALDGTDLVVDWGTQHAAEPVKPRVAAPASVEGIDFDSQDGHSVFTVRFDAPVELIAPEVNGDIIIFGAKEAVIPRSLRRVVDASVFPSSVLQITPYSTIVAGKRNVMFSAKMKGPVEYSVNTFGQEVVFRCVDGAFAEPAPLSSSAVYVPVVSATDVSHKVEAAPVKDETVEQVLDALAGGGFEPSGDEELSAAKIYTGTPVTLVLDDADIRKVMQLIAEISNLNIILSDDVKGDVTLRLHDVPWDQALDLILEIKELGTITQGNVVRVLPKKTILAMEEARLKAKQSLKKLEETQTEIFEISYKDTDTIESVIDDILSPQGEVKTIDGSKKIMVNDIPSKLDEVRELLIVLDEPVKQVMIEARIVEMRETDGLDLGINWGLNYTNDVGLSNIDNSLVTDDGAGNTTEQTLLREDGVQTVTTSATDASGNSFSTSSTDLLGIGTSTINDLAFGLGGSFLLPSTFGTSGLGGLINFGRVGLDSTVINLRISALEATGSVKVVSSPKVLTLDGEAARIEQGTSIPYQSTSDEGTTTEFQDATLSLEVTPEVNPNNTVILQIKATNSSVGSNVSSGLGSVPAIDTKEAETKLMLMDGETTVIGGIYIDSSVSSNTGTPFLKDIPFLGKLFESNSSSTDRSELLIFITPHIVE